MRESSIHFHILPIFYTKPYDKVSHSDDPFLVELMRVLVLAVQVIEFSRFVQFP